MNKDYLTQKRNANYLLTLRLSFTPFRGNWSAWGDKNVLSLQNNFRESATKLEGELLDFQRHEDSVELELSYCPSWSIAKIVNLLKTRSSRALNGKWERIYYVKSTDFHGKAGELGEKND